MSISGDGYFTVTDGGNTPYYTRAGNFYLDADGNLVSSEGYSLIGRMAIGQRDQTTGVSNGDPNKNAFDPTNDNPNDEPITDGNRKLFIPSEVSTTQEVAADGKVTYNDVDPAIKLKSFSIGQDGSINAIYEGDKQPRKIGQIQVTKFTNTEGLEKVGGNLYTVSANSGDPQEVWPTSGGSGSIVSGTLEMSNVDLSEEFTEMIVGQRSFQANSRIITTSDEILQELVNLKR